MTKSVLCSALSIAPDLTLFHTGPSLDKGAMPALFYFALSGEDSLCLDPFNQPVQFLSSYPIRIFSLTLPAHEANLPPKQALATWAEDMEKGKDIISEFVDKALTAISYGINQGLISPDKIGVAGLSRGGFIASHLASREKKINYVLQFAPLTDLRLAKEFSLLKELPLVESLHVNHLSTELCKKHVRLYIGNRDTRVGTASSFSFLESVVSAASSENVRNPQIELFISPSIGHQGHGTPPHIFKQGAEWMAQCLLP